MSTLVSPSMPSRPVHHLVVVTLVIAAHAGVIGLLENGLQSRAAPEVSSPSVLTVGLIAPEPVAPAPVTSRPTPEPATVQQTRTPPAPRPSARAAPVMTPLNDSAASPPLPLPASEPAMAVSPIAEPQADVAHGVAEARPAPGAGSAHPQANPGNTQDALRTSGGTPAAPLLQLPSAAASYLNNPPPRYPPMSRRLGEQGQVIVRARIEVDGSASQAQINTSSGHTRLDETALQTVLSWRYTPGTRNGVPEAMWFHIPIHFVLE